MSRLRAGAHLLAVVIALATVAAAPAAAQQLTPKHSSLTPLEQRCTPEPPLREVSAARRAEASQLASQGDQALLLGDPRAARDRFVRAAEADPSSATVAYRLGRTHEELDERDEAARQYCRYLALAADAPDAQDVLGRIDALRPAQKEGMRAAADLFDRGVAALAAGRMDEASRDLSGAIERVPHWADAYYNRAIAEAERGEPRRAERDLRRYLELRPDAADRAAVAGRITLLGAQRAPHSPSGALARGLLVPGLGQLYTGRPVFGVLVLAGAGTTYALALRQTEVTRTVRRTDPFGNPYDEEFVVRQRPDLGRGVALAAAITALGAVEAFLYARRADDGASRSSGASPLPQLSTDADHSLILQWQLPARW